MEEKYQTSLLAAWSIHQESWCHCRFPWYPCSTHSRNLAASCLHHPRSIHHPRLFITYPLFLNHFIHVIRVSRPSPAQHHAYHQWRKHMQHRQHQALLLHQPSSKLPTHTYSTSVHSLVISTPPLRLRPTVTMTPLPCTLLESFRGANRALTISTTHAAPERSQKLPAWIRYKTRVSKIR